MIIGEMRYADMWRRVTGGGKPVAYLRWLADRWDEYHFARLSIGDGPITEFDVWMAVKFRKKNN